MDFTCEVPEKEPKVEAFPAQPRDFLSFNAALVYNYDNWTFV